MAVSQLKIKALYSDIGGVLGTNGWDGGIRQRMCAHFEVDPAEIEGRHRLMFDSYERGYMSFDEYLRRVFLHVQRGFSVERLRDFAYSQSVPWPDNIAFLRTVKALNGLAVGLISNEGEGITQHRVRKFELRELADFLVISHFVHMRKPDREIWNLALNLAQVSSGEAVYIDDREMFASIAGDMGFRAIHHTTLESTRSQLRSFGLLVE